MTLVVDTGIVVAALTDQSPIGDWALDLFSGEPLSAPQLVLVETTNVLRRLELARNIPPEVALTAYQDLFKLPIDLYPYAPFRERIWSLRASVTAYDAWYVALAEELDVPLATFDLRLTRSSGPRCTFVTAPRPS